MIEAQRRTIALIEVLIDKTKLFDRLSGQLNERQQNALLRMFKEGPEGFKGGSVPASTARSNRSIAGNHNARPGRSDGKKCANQGRPTQARRLSIGSASL
jgi:hypothetical protein